MVYISIDILYMDDIEERKNILKTDLMIIKKEIRSAEDLIYYIIDDLKYLKDEELELNLKNQLNNIKSYLSICDTILINCNRLISK